MIGQRSSLEAHLTTPSNAGKPTKRGLWDFLSRKVRETEPTAKRSNLPPMAPPDKIARLLASLSLERKQTLAGTVTEIGGYRVSVPKLTGDDVELKLDEELTRIAKEHDDRDRGRR